MHIQALCHQHAPGKAEEETRPLKQVFDTDGRAHFTEEHFLQKLESPDVFVENEMDETHHAIARQGDYPFCNQAAIHHLWGEIDTIQYRPGILHHKELCGD